MKIGVLTSSRADFGIYLPLLQKMKVDDFFDLHIIAFGTHTSMFHGYTISEIQKEKFSKVYEISSLIVSDDEQAIATSYGLTVIKFADFWKNHCFDFVLCLGDRFEMSAAVQSGIPYGIRFAHIHGGETTLGAIDNIFRHQITMASILHFTSTEVYTEKIIQMTGEKSNVYTVGSISLEEMSLFKPMDKNVFFQKYNLPVGDYALVTFHPETISSTDNIKYALEMKIALAKLSKTVTIVITMPNADTLGTAYRERLLELKNENSENIILIENFGKANYFSAMYYAKIMIGNTSSGIIEAASFGKYVVNVGSRQKGRAQSQNILDAQFESDDIFEKSNTALALGVYEGDNMYYSKGASDKIINI